MKRATTMLGALAVIATGFLFAAPAAQAGTEGPYGGVTCTDYPTQTGGWPTDNSHFLTCFSYTTQHANQIKAALNGLRGNVKTVLSANDVNVYYFANRTDANNFFDANPDYSNAPVGVFESNEARCGQTGHYVWQDLGGTTHHRIAIAIYEQCTFDSTTPTIPDRHKVAEHEAGHAYAYSLAAEDNKQNGADISSGYKQLVDYDRTELNNISTVCGVFGSNLPSDYEIDLGTPNDKVCAGSTIQTPYVGKTKKEIADIRAPYFVDPANQTPAGDKYAELWAEQFSIIAGGVGGNLNKFTVVDNIIKKNRYQCSYWHVRAYYDTGAPVGPNNPLSQYQQFPSSWGCPSVTEASQE